MAERLIFLPQVGHPLMVIPLNILAQVGLNIIMKVNHIFSLPG